MDEPTLGAVRSSSAIPAPASPSRLEVRGISSGYHGKVVLEDVSFVINEPGIYVVLGPNGAGKTTLFRTLAGILEPYSGSIEFGGEDPRNAPQSHRLQYLSHIDGFPDGLRVEEGLRFYADAIGVGEREVDGALRLLEIDGLRRKFFSELSAGQKRRAAIARVFLQERGIFLLDEPTSSLDPKLARETRDLVLGLSKNDVVLYSSHNLFEAKEIGKYVLALRNGRVGYFGLLSDLKPTRYRIGIRTAETTPELSALPKKGEYYVKELAGPQEVSAFVADLMARGVQIREVKELENPLEDLFT